MRKGWKKWCAVLGLALGAALVLPEVAQAQSGCVLGCPEPPDRSAELEAVLAIAFMVFQYVWLWRYGQR